MREPDVAAIAMHEDQETGLTVGRLPGRRAVKSGRWRSGSRRSWRLDLRLARRQITCQGTRAASGATDRTAGVVPTELWRWPGFQYDVWV
jgi:hypothetical protein